MPKAEPTRLFAEFVVIVIGVLVALGVDEWRENASDRASEAQYVERLISELVNDSTEMALAIRIGSRKAAGIDRVLGRLSDAAWVHERPSAVFPDLTYTYARPELQTTTFDELRGAGGLSLVRDEELRFRIGHHYRSSLHDFGRLDERRTALARARMDLFPPVDGLPGSPLFGESGVLDSVWAAAIDSAFLAAPNAPERLRRLQGPEYQGLLNQERAYARAIESISAQILESTAVLLAELREYADSDHIENP